MALDPDIDALLPPREFCPQVPYDKQLAFLVAPQRELFFGGAAGPGKSSALLMGAFQYARNPEYRALLIRKTLRQLDETLIPRAREWIAGSRAQWNGTDRRITFPGGAQVKFAYLDAEDDVHQFEGTEYHYIGFDELTAFSEWQYTYLFRSLRTRQGCAIPLRMRSASNPGWRGHDWVKQRFMIGRPAAELARAYPDRLYIRAVMGENRALNTADYLKSLAEMEVTRRTQLIEGDWDLKPSGKLFNPDWFELVDDWPRGEIAAAVRAWDLAASQEGDWTVGVLMALSRAGVFYLLDVNRFRGSSLEVETALRNTMSRDQTLRHVPAMIQQEPGAAGKAYAEALIRGPLRGFEVIVETPNGKKYTRALPLSSAAEHRNVKVLRAPWNELFFDELRAAGPDEKAYDWDDQWDAASSAFNYLADGRGEFGWRSVKDLGREQSGRDRFAEEDRKQPRYPKSRRFTDPGCW